MKHICLITFHLFLLITILLALPSKELNKVIPSSNFRGHRTSDSPQRTLIEASLNYRGLGVSVSSTDSEDVILSPGDYIGNIDGFHAILRSDCKFTFYDRDQVKWIYDPNDYIPPSCKLAVQRDGDIVLYYSENPNIGGYYSMWLSYTHNMPARNELRVEDGRLLIIQTFKDGSKRTYYAYEGFFSFVDDIPPRRVAETTITLNQNDDSDVILNIKDYIGDIDGVHAMLENTCSLVLYDGKTILWKSWSIFVKVYKSCELVLQRSGGLVAYGDISYKIFWFDFYPDPIQTQLKIEDGQLLIIQTFKDGSTSTFYADQSTELEFREKLGNPRQLWAPTIKSTDSNDFIIKRMDYLGDLNGVHAILEKNCNFVLYNVKNILWQSNTKRSRSSECRVALQRDGHLVIYRSYSSSENPRWASKTQTNPTITQLKVEDGKLKIIQTFEDQPQRVFIAHEGTSEFWEDLRNPRLIAEISRRKKQSDPNKIIFRRNEYLGDLAGIHAILEPNCKFVVYNRNTTVWYLDPNIPNTLDCVITARNDEYIVLADNPEYGNVLGIGELIRPPTLPNITLIESEFKFEEEQLIINQTFSDGSHRALYTREGTNTYLQEKLGPPRRIAETSLTIKANDEADIILQRNDYIGDLAGLHVILQDDCNFVLHNRDRTIWDSRTRVSSYLDCRVQIRRDGRIILQSIFSPGESYTEIIFNKTIDYNSPVETQLKLGTDQLLIFLIFADGSQRTYYSDDTISYPPNKFEEKVGDLNCISPTGIKIEANDQKDFIFRKNDYIGDTSGLWAVLLPDCNFVLYNYDQAVWSTVTGTTVSSYCEFAVKRDGALELTFEASGSKVVMWSASYIGKTGDQNLAQTELKVEEEKLRLVYTFTDGSIEVYDSVVGISTFAKV